MKTYWIVLPDCTSLKKTPGNFLKGAHNSGPQDRVPDTRAPATFTLRYWSQFVVWRNFVNIFVDNINVLDLALWAEKILKLNVVLCNFFKKCIYCGQLILRKISKIGATRCQILRLKCTKFDFRWAPHQTPLGSLQRSPRPPSCI